MRDPEQRKLGPAIWAVLILAVLIVLPGYFATRLMDTGGPGNPQAGLSVAIVAGIACIGALAGFLVLWAGRKRASSNSRIALVATLFVAVLLLFVAYGAQTSSTQPGTSAPQS